MTLPKFVDVRIPRSLVEEFRRTRNVVVRCCATEAFTGSSKSQNQNMILAAVLLAEAVEKETP